MPARRTKYRLSALVGCLAVASGCSPFHVPRRVEALLGDTLPSKGEVQTISFREDLEPHRAEESVARQGVQPSRSNEYEILWDELRTPALSMLLARVLQDNLSLWELVHRLRQSRAEGATRGSGQFPTVDISLDASRSRADLQNSTGASRALPQEVSYFNSFAVRPALAYEVDLWGRLGDRARAAASRVDGSEEELRAAQLSLAGEGVDRWYQLCEASRRISLLESQDREQARLLAIVERRYRLGRVRAGDLYAQREARARSAVLVPEAHRGRDLLEGEFARLLSQAASEVSEELRELRARCEMPIISEPRSLPAPYDLLTTRPDLRAALAEVRATEFDLSATLAERLPALKVGFSYSFQSGVIEDLLESTLGAVSESLSFPLVDGGRRRGEVTRARAVVDQAVTRFAARFLGAIQEVEVALSTERARRETVRLVKRQEHLARASYRDARSRYSQGLVDLRTAILALTALEEAQRRTVSEERLLVSARVALLTALGVAPNLSQGQKGIPISGKANAESRSGMERA